MTSSRLDRSARRPKARADASTEASRRTEILQTADSIIASHGLRASVQQIADVAGILAGSLYHHFESKEAILVELIRRYHDDLDRIGDEALERLDQPDPPPAEELIFELARDIARCAVEHRPHCRCRSSKVPAPIRNWRH